MGTLKLTLKNITTATFIILSLILPCRNLEGQILDDPETVNIIRKGIDCIYNSEFIEADKYLDEINARYPGHPGTDLYKSIMIYYRNYPLVPADPQFKTYEKLLASCIEKCERKENWIDNPEMLLTNLCARGLLLTGYSTNSMNNEIFPIARSIYKGIRKSFDYKHVYPDFSYFTGLYDYYSEAYPEVHPIFKPLAALFPDGNRQAGLRDLVNAAENSIFLAPEAYSLLSWVHIYYENNIPAAEKYCRTICEKYPANLMFRGECIKILLMQKKYGEAEKIISLSENIRHQFFEGQLFVFMGIVQEKKYRNYVKAKSFYEEGIRYLENYGARSRDFVKFAEDGARRANDIQTGKSRRTVEKLVNAEPEFDVL